MFAIKDHLWTIFYICVMLKLYGVAQVMKTRYDERPPPLNISHDLSSVIHGDHLHVVDRENVSVLLAPDIRVCQQKHVFIITSAMTNKHLRDKGEFILLFSQNIVLDHFSKK